MREVVYRRDIRRLSTPERDNLVRAFWKMQQLDPRHPDSFFSIAGLHGLPFRGAGYANPAWWGGYCNHGNVLFPTWHRAYLRRLEQALQAQVYDVALPYWDELERATSLPPCTDVDASKDCIPDVFLRSKYTFANGEIIDNPLFSYTLQRTVFDTLQPNPGANYTKHKDYQTVRYPFSGLVGTKEDREYTKCHNYQIAAKGEAETDRILNLNVYKWLNLEYYTSYDEEKRPAGARTKYRECLDAPNYTVFSNTTSAQRWNEEHVDTKDAVTAVSLETPHNWIHLAVGGFDVPNLPKASEYPNANGDMGENDTASFDPIFYFHHCFIDLMFWRWQVKHGQTVSLDIIEGYPGTNSVDSQGPTPGVVGGTWLNMDSPLEPFRNPRDPSTAMTSKDVVNPAWLGYEYAEVSVTPDPDYYAGLMPAVPMPVLMIQDINRSHIAGGSFVISAWTTTEDGKEKNLVGVEGVLSRRHVSGCQNCQTHLEVRPHIPLYGFGKEEAEKAKFIARVDGHKIGSDDRRLQDDYRDEGEEHKAQRVAWKVSVGHL